MNRYNFKQVEEKWQGYWLKNNTFKSKKDPNKKKFYWYCMLCTVFSVLGGIIGYYIGFIFWDEIGIHITEYFALTDQINSFKELYNENGSLAVFIAGVSPIPYKLVTIISGISSMNFFYFLKLEYLFSYFYFVFFSC